MAGSILDFHTVLDAKHTFLNLSQFPPATILENQRLADAQGFAVHFEDPFAAIVLDPVIIAHGYQLLPHLIVGLIQATPNGPSRLSWRASRRCSLLSRISTSPLLLHTAFVHRVVHSSPGHHGIATMVLVYLPDHRYTSLECTVFSYCVHR